MHCCVLDFFKLLVANFKCNINMHVFLQTFGVFPFVSASQDSQTTGTVSYLDVVNCTYWEQQLIS